MYKTLNEHYKEKFGCKVYKLSVDAGFSCPNRDGTVGSKGCIFCSEKGSGEFAVGGNDILAQLERAKEKVSCKIKSGKYIAYFQSFTNTYANVKTLETLYRCYETEMDFRKMFNEQKMFCMPHYERLIAGVDKKKMKSYSGEFVKNLNRITKEYSVSLHEDVKKYTTMYDYRNNTENADWGNSRDAVERSIAFLTGNEVE